MTDAIDWKARVKELERGQGYLYIGRNGKAVLARDLEERAEAAEAEVWKLREALEWYAEQAEWCRKIGSRGDPARHALDNDGGKRARAALTPVDDAKET